MFEMELENMLNIKAVNFLLWQDHPEKESEKEKEKDAKSGVSLSSYWPFFRELDVEALSVLQCGLLSRTLLDTELHSKVKQVSLLCDSLYKYILKL